MDDSSLSFHLLIQVAYACSLFGGLAFFVLAPRVADWYSVAFGSAVVYFFPGLLGETTVPGETLAVNSSTYSIMTLVLTGITIAAILKDRQRVSAGLEELRHDGNDSNATGLAVIFTAIQTAGFIYAVFSSGNALLATNKHEMASTFNQGHLLWLMGAPTAFIASVHSRSYFCVAINALSLCAIMFIGSRNQLAIGVIGATAILLARRGARPIISNRRMCLGILCFAAVIFLYKQCYIAIKAGDMSGAKHRLAERWQEAFIQSEPVAIQHILNVVTEENYRVDTSTWLYESLSASVLPGGSARESSFGDRSTFEIFGDMGYGMASNIWAEFFAYGGFIGVVIGLFLFLSAIWKASATARTDWQLFLCSFMPWWCFYIHRNDTYRIASFGKQLVALFLVAIVVRSVANLGSGLYHSTRSSSPRGKPIQRRAAA